MKILKGDQIDLMALLHCASVVRRHYFNNTVSIHRLENVRNGACSEDCGYCGQSITSNAKINEYQIKQIDELVENAKKAKQCGAFRFCMALSGRGPTDKEIDHMCRAVKRINDEVGIRPCLSAGILDTEKAAKLKAVGLDRMNHNINTSQHHYSNICSTHTYQQRIETLRAARVNDLSICSGVIIGMGETYRDILDMAYALRDIRADSIPVNFLLPIQGNRISHPTCNDRDLTPEFVLRVMCLFRLINPSVELRIGAGREFHLRCMQPFVLWPANSLFIGGYLLAPGQDALNTLAMIFDAGFQPRLDEGVWPKALKQFVDSRCDNTQTIQPQTNS